MKITKLQKQAIVRAIMQDVPKPDKAKRHRDVQALLVKGMSPECRKVYNKTPRVFIGAYSGDLTYDGCDWSTRELIVGMPLKKC
jgi:hypothetical protein